MAEALVIHASTPERIRRFNKAVSELKVPFEGKLRKGHAPVFPYKVELWVYKTKEEAMPAFLEFLNSNTGEVSVNGYVRPIQSLACSLTWAMSTVAGIRNIITHIRNRIHGRTQLNQNNGFFAVNMKKYNVGKPIIPGWGHSKVLGVFKDCRNSRGQEEL